MTIFGSYTVAELIDLLAAKDYEIGQIQQAIDSRHGNPVDATFAADWKAVQDRYNAAKTVANAAIALAKVTPGPNSMILADSEYQGVLKAVKQDPSTITKGDLQDIHNRLDAAGSTPVYPKMPQPDPDSDFEENAIKTLDKLPGGGPPSPPMPWWKKALIGAGGVVALGVVIKIAK